MPDPESPTQPLMAATSQQSALNEPPAQSGRSSRAYKVAGLTLLACILIVGQAMVAYFLLSQRNDIKSLEEQNNNMQTQLTKGRSVSVPMKMHMNSLPMLMDDYLEEEASTEVPTDAQESTECQLEASGMKRPQVPGFLPACDERGLYRAQQCFRTHCWCVNPANGKEIPGSLRKGRASCRASVVTGGLSNMLTLHDADN